MSLFGNILKSGGQSAAQKTTVFLADKFPEITSNAQLMTFRDQVQQKAIELETLRARLTSDKNALDVAQSNVDRYKKAGDTLLTQKANAKPGDDISDVEKGISEIVPILKKNNEILTDAKQRYAETQQDFSNKEADLKKASEYLSTMQQKLSDLARENERLKDEEDRQKQRMKEASKSVGIGTSSDTAVIDALTKRNADRKIQVNGLKTAADSITQATTPPEATGALADALKGADAPAKSADDELRSLLS
jgi:chromosome segregation ATPase